MSQRNSATHSPPLFERICGCTDGNSVHGIALVGLGVLGALVEATATASCVAALFLGWPLLLGPLAFKREFEPTVQVPWECHADAHRPVQQR